MRPLIVTCHRQLTVVEFAWIESCLKHGSRLPEAKFLLRSSHSASHNASHGPLSHQGAAATSVGGVSPSNADFPADRESGAFSERIRSGHVGAAGDSVGRDEGGGKDEEGNGGVPGLTLARQLPEGSIGGKEEGSDEEEENGAATGCATVQGGRQVSELSEEEKAFWMEVIFESAAWAAVVGEEEGGGREGGSGGGYGGKRGWGGGGRGGGKWGGGGGKRRYVSGTDRFGAEWKRWKPGEKGEKGGKRGKGGRGDEEIDGVGGMGLSGRVIQLVREGEEVLGHTQGLCVAGGEREDEKEGGREEVAQGRREGAREGEEVLGHTQGLCVAGGERESGRERENGGEREKEEERERGEVVQRGMESGREGESGLGDEWRWFSYYKALSVLEKLPFRIVSAQQVQGLPSIGSSLQGKIQEILSYGMIKKLRAYQADDMVRTLSLFSARSGELAPAPPAGSTPLTTARSTASHAFNLHTVPSLLFLPLSPSPTGHRSLRQLAGDPGLTPTQQIALRFHDDMNKRIPRDEVAAMAALVVKEGEALQPGVSAARGECCEGWVLPGVSAAWATATSWRGWWVGRLKHVGMVTEGLVVPSFFPVPVWSPQPHTFLSSHHSHCSFLEGLVGRLKHVSLVTEDLVVPSFSFSSRSHPAVRRAPTLTSPSHLTRVIGACHRGFLDRLVGRLKLVGFLTEDLMVGTHHSQQVMRGCKAVKSNVALEKLMGLLKHVGFLTGDLVVGTHHSQQPHGEGKGVDTYFGLCRQAGREQRHRIDFKVPGTAAGKSVSCGSERAVFDFLGLPWLEPHERNL
ncbi:unnamed protein product [Closterium sp. Naga37s-1]|nr:unnamed protein product [Closterium sp. Naga37s-1]